jgi:hypothetical protein
MNVLLYPEYAYLHVVSGQFTELGRFNIPEDGDLSLAHLRVYHKNSDPFSYKMRLIVTQKSKGATLVESDWETFSNETSEQSEENWLGDLTFTFPDYAFKGNDPVHLRMEIAGYTRVGTSQWLGVWADWAFGADWYKSVGTAPSGGSMIALGVRR